MEFGEEIAVFQSAVQLANRTCRGGLRCFNICEQQSRKLLDIVIDAVHEIQQGLSCDISRCERQYWSEKLTELSAWRTVATLPELAHCGNRPPTFIRHFPDWNPSFFYQLLKENRWMYNLLKFINTTEHEIGATLIELILLQIGNVTELNASDISNLIELMEFLCIMDNRFMFRHDLNDEIVSDKQETHQKSTSESSLAARKITVGLLRTLEKIWPNATLQTLPSNEMMWFVNAWLNFLQMLTCNSALVVENCVSNIECKFKSNSAPCMKCDLKIDSEVYNSNEKLMDLHLSRVPLREALVLCDTHDAEEIQELLMSSILRANAAFTEIDLDLSGFKRTCQVDGDDEIFLSPSIWEYVRRELFLTAFKSLKMSELNSKQLKAALDDMLGNVNSIYDQLRATVETSQNNLSDPRFLFEQALVAVEQRIGDVKVFFRSLMQTESKDLITDNRWLESVVKNSNSASSCDDFIILCQCLARCRQLLDNSRSEKLQISILATFELLTVEKRNTIIQKVHANTIKECDNSADLFDVASDQFDSDLLKVLNKLTNCEEDILSMAKIVSVFAIKKPVKTIERLVKVRCTTKEGSMALSRQILHWLPVLVELDSLNDENLICKFFVGHYFGTELSSKEKQNSLTFLRGMLASNGEEKVLLPAHLVFQICIHPFTDRIFPDSSVLNLANVVLGEIKTSSTLSWMSLEMCSSLPILVWFCQIVDLCRNGSTDISDEQRFNSSTKELAVKGLNSLVEMLVQIRHDIPEKSLTWLRQNLLSLHWTTCHYVQPVFGEKFLVFPSYMIESLHIDSNLVDRIIQSQDGVVSGLVEFSIISDTTINMITGRLQVEQISSKQSTVYGQLVHALCKILPSCFAVEWIRVHKFLLHLSHSNRLASSDNYNCSTEFVEAETVDHLAACHTFVDVFLVLNELNKSPDCGSLSISWKDLVTMFTSTLKTCFLNSENIDTLSSDVRHRLVPIIFGFVFRLVSCVPIQSSEQLVYFVLDAFSSLVDRGNEDEDTNESKFTMGDELGRALDEMNQLCDLQTVLVKLNQRTNNNS